MAVGDVPPLDPRAYAILAEAGLGEDLFNPRQHRSCELVERYTGALAADILARLGATARLDAPRTADELLAAIGAVAGFARPLGWLLAHAAAAGHLVRDAEGRYRLAPARPAIDLAALRTAGLASDPSYAPTYALLDEVAALHPRVARGETSGERALFLRAALWAAYFDNRNGYYALSNRVAARAAATRLAGPGGAVLEVGAGLGSAAGALLEEVAARDALARVTRWMVTEPVVFFRRRAERTLTAAHPDLPFAFAGLDISTPWGAQGVAPGSCALVWGVNVFHLAVDLDATLREARAALAPGGWLVVGEGLRPRADATVGAELAFQLLESFAAVQLDPTIRPTPGFLTAEHWLAVLARAGFGHVELVPDVVRLQPFYPGFLGAALCARRE